MVRLQVIFTGFKSNNNSFIGIRDVQIWTQICDLAPRFASPGGYIGVMVKQIVHKYYKSILNSSRISFSGFKCSKAQFRCANGECAPSVSRCNGVNDGCRDGSDEKDCDCLSNQFQCNDECVTVDKVCDGRKDCMDGTDEKYCEGRGM